MVDDDKLVTVGCIGAAHGIKGWVKLNSYTQPIDNLLAYPEHYIQRAGKWQKIEFDQGRRQGKGLIAHIIGCDDRDMTAVYARAEIAVAKEQLDTLESGEFYWHQLEGLKVFTVAGGDSRQLLGVIDHLIETGSNDVLVVKACQGSIDKQERLIPYRPDDVVQEIDLEKACVVVDWDPEF